MFGFARPQGSAFGLFLGQQKISCADDFEDTPREGTYAAVVIPSPVVGTNGAVAMNLLEVTDGELAQKLATGSLEVTAVSDTDVSAVFGFDTNDNGMRYAVSGAVTMLRCP